jgi:hypothetical protein
MCVDYRGLNAVTKKIRQPLPRIDELLDRLRGATCFSSLDLASGYWQVPVKEEHRHLTAFQADGELWEWTVMPFGLCGAPATFQKMMQKILAPYRDFTAVYLDDILVFSATPEQHTEHLALVMEALEKANLMACRVKCHLYRAQLKFLGHEVSNGGIKPNLEKVRAVVNYPRPKTLRQLRGFLALAGWYRRFINDFAGISGCLSDLESPAKFRAWGEDSKEEEAFTKLKSALVSAPVLLLPDPSKPYVVRTDASLFRVAAELLQYGPDGELHPVSYYSRKMAAPERNYDPRSAELLAIYEALRHWRCYLEGSQFEIQVHTDHQSLQHFATQKELNRRETRWMSFFSQYDGLNFEYRPGKEQVVPDSLSRVEEGDEASAGKTPFIPDRDAKEDPCQPVTATLTPHSADYGPWRSVYSNIATKPCPPMDVTEEQRQDRFLMWRYYREITDHTGPLEIDAFCDARGLNSHCRQFWSSEDSALQHDWAGKKVWAHPPYEPEIMAATIRHAVECWKSSPHNTKVVLMVPAWFAQSAWYELLQVEPWRLLLTYPEKTSLFLDHRGVRLPPARWPVQVYFLDSLPTPTTSRTATFAAAAARLYCATSLNAVTLIHATERSVLQRAADEDPEYHSQLQAVERRPTAYPDYEIRDGLLYFRGVVQVPAGDRGRDLRRQIIWECHDCILSGHKGVQKTVELVRRRATWEGLTRDVEEYVSTCPACQAAKKGNLPPVGKLHPLPIPDRPFQSCSLDWMTDLPVATGGKDSLLVVVDRFSKHVTLIPCCSTDTVQKVAHRYLKHVVRHHGLQESLVSDRDTKFVSAFWISLMELLGTRLDMTTTAHQQANGQVEVQMRIIAAALRSLPPADRKKWLDIVPHLEFALNNAVHRGTGYSPFFVLKGYHPLGPVDMLLKSKQVSVGDLREFVARLRENQVLTVKALERAQRAMKKWYDQDHLEAPVYAVGSEVMLRTEGLTAPRLLEGDLPKKLQRPWSGPFTVLEVLDNDNYKLELPKLWQMHPVFHVSRLKPYKESERFDRDEPCSPPAWDVETESALSEVESIIRAKYLPARSKHPAQFLVKWKDLPVEKASWRTYAELQGCKELVHEFLRSHGHEEVMERLQSSISP